MRTSHRPAALAVVAAALLVLTAACGGGGSKKSSSNPTPAPLTTAKAQTLAKAAVLTAADMPGYKAEESENDPNDKATDQRIAECLGTTKPTYLAENPGMTFTKGDLEVDSSADVAPSVATAKAEVAALTSPKLKDCVKQEFAKLLADSHGVITAFEITPQPTTVTGADETFAYTFDLRANVAGQQLHFNGLDVGALVGQVEVDLSVFDQSGSNGLTVEQASGLLQKAVDRTKAAA